MKILLPTALAAALMLFLPMTVLAASPAPAAAGSPALAGLATRQIKALSDPEREDLLAGRGTGYALAAELNGYPGPAQVMELNRELSLNADQRSKTESLVKAVERRAKNYGYQLVDAEQALDALFVSKKITPELLTESLTRIGELQARVRGAHLEANLEQSRILTPEQIALYNKLRGYPVVTPGSPRGGAYKR